MRKGLTLQAAAERIGISQRQVRRLVLAGSLQATGGGHGVPLRFDVRAVDRFRPDYRRRWRPFACNVPKWQVFARYSGTLVRSDDVLARTSNYAYTLDRLTRKENDAYSGFMQCASATFAKHDKMVRLSREFWRHDGHSVGEWLSLLLPINRVRSDLIECARKMDTLLDSAGWDFMLAAKIVRHSPTQKAIDRAARLKKRLTLGRREGDFQNANKIFLGHQEMTQEHRRFHSGFLCDNAIARVLGIHRQQAARMRERVFSQLGQNMLWMLVALQVPAGIDTFSKTWLRSINKIDPEIFDLQPVKKMKMSKKQRELAKCPECPGCSEKVSATAQTCPECGRLL